MKSILFLVLITPSVSFAFGPACADLLRTNSALKGVLKVIEVDKASANLHEAQKLLDDLNSLSGDERATLTKYMKSHFLNGIRIVGWYDAGYKALELSAGRRINLIEPKLSLLPPSHIIRDGRLFNSIKLETRLNEIVDADVLVNPTEIQTRLDVDAVIDFFQSNRKQINQNLSDRNISNLTLGLELNSKPIAIFTHPNSPHGAHLRVEIKNSPRAVINPA